MSEQLIQNAFVELGTNFVQRYQQMSRENADRMPEQFLGPVMASELYERLRCRVFIERQYSDIAKHLGVWTRDLDGAVRGWEADLAIYDQEAPTDILELKILGDVSLLQKDINKGKVVSDWNVAYHLGVVLLENANRTLQQRKADLEMELGSQVLYGPTRKSRDTRWDWCFTCFTRKGNLKPSELLMSGTP